MERRQPHPFALIFPRLDPSARAVLKADIEQNALNENIVGYEGMILDGINREDILTELGFTPEQIEGVIIPFEVTPWAQARADKDLPLDPLGFVLAKNLYRRHLNESQRAMVAAKLATMRQGERTDLPSIEGRLSQEAAAETLNVSVASVERASTVQREGAPELRDAVETGRVAVSAAADVASLPKPQQRELVVSLQVDDKGQLTPESRQAFNRVAKQERDRKTAEKKVRRGEREQQLATKILTLPEQKFGVILEDFEWDDEVYSRETGLDRHASNHYPTSGAHTPEEIVAATAERFSVAADDCVLLMWTTNQHLAIALQVMALRGFGYRSEFVWRKPGLSTGRWNRSRHEHLLIGARGKVVAPAPGTQFDSCLDGEKGAHSEKPDWQYEIAEAYFPNIPKIELNARRARPGWTAWGLDAPSQEIAPPPPDTRLTLASCAQATARPAAAQESDGESGPEVEPTPPASSDDESRASAMGSCSHESGAAILAKSGKPPHEFKPLDEACCEHFAGNELVAAEELNVASAGSAWPLKDGGDVSHETSPQVSESKNETQSSFEPTPPDDARPATADDDLEIPPFLRRRA